MQSLFKISNEFQLVINELIENGGELSDDLASQLEISQSQLKEKSANYAQVIRAMEYDNSILDAELKRLNEMKRSRKNTIERLKNALSGALQQFDIDQIETPTTRISFRTSQAIEIVDESRIPKEYKTQVVTTKIDKTEIKRSIKNGITIDGATLITKQNLQIK